MKAVLGETTVAEADRDDLISIEGNWYFPPSSVRWELLQESPTPYTCPWKGECQYFSVKDGDTATLQVAVPAGLPAGAATLTVKAVTNGTTVTLPLTVAAGTVSSNDPQATAAAGPSLL